MVINQRLMSYMRTEEALKMLKNDEYDKGLNSKYNRSNPSYLTSCKTLATYDSFDNHIANLLLNNPSIIDKKDLSRYRNYLYTSFKKAPNIIFESLMFTKEIAPLIFSNTELKEIEEYKNKSALYCKSIYDKITQGKRTTSEENNIFFGFLIRKISSENQNVINLLDDVYKRLLSLPNIPNLKAKEFLLKYTGHLARKDLRIPPVDVYLTNSDLADESYTKNNYGTSYGNTGIISINKELVNSNVSPIPNIPSIIKFMQTVCHETKHSEQAYKASINDLSYSSFEWIRTNIFRTYLSQDSFNEYMANYQHNEIERDANLYGWRMAEKVLKKYAPARKQEIDVIISTNIGEFYKGALANKRDTHIRMPKEYYNVKMMDEIVRKNPNLIQSYPQLSYIYNSNGQRKSFLELVSINKRLERSTDDSINISKIFYDYFISDLKSGVLNTIDVYSLDKEKQYDLFSRLQSIVVSEIDFINRSISILSNNNIETFEHINKERLSRIINLLNYLNSHQKLINYLIEEDIKEINKRVFGFKMRIIDDKLKSLQRKFYKDKNIEQTKIYEDLMSLTGSDIHGPHK